MQAPEIIKKMFLRFWHRLIEGRMDILDHNERCTTRVIRDVYSMDLAEWVATLLNF